MSVVANLLALTLHLRGSAAVRGSGQCTSSTEALARVASPANIPRYKQPYANFVLMN